MVTKPKNLTPKQQIARSSKIIGNLGKELVAHQRRSKNLAVPLEYIGNRCVNHIRKIRRHAPRNPDHQPRTEIEKLAVAALERAYESYQFIQEYVTNTSESLHRRPGTVEFSLDDLDVDEDGEYKLFEDGVVEPSAPDIHSGGLGYRHVNWDAEYLMAVTGTDRHHNPFWNPTAGKRDKRGRLLLLEDSDYWATKPKKPDAWDKLVEGTDR